MPALDDVVWFDFLDFGGDIGGLLNDTLGRAGWTRRERREAAGRQRGLVDALRGLIGCALDWRDRVLEEGRDLAKIFGRSAFWDRLERA